MAPNISKLAKYQSSAVCLAGVSAAVWIIVYGKISHSRRRFATFIFIVSMWCEVHSPIEELRLCQLLRFQIME